MIVYNVDRKWFTEKADAEVVRKLLGLKPGATLKVEVSGRADLAALLNAICEPPAPPAKLDHPLLNSVVERAFARVDRAIPDYVPLFLIDKDQRAAVQADRNARGCTGEE